MLGEKKLRKRSTGIDPIPISNNNNGNIGNRTAIAANLIGGKRFDENNKKKSFRCLPFLAVAGCSLLIIIISSSVLLWTRKGNNEAVVLLDNQDFTLKIHWNTIITDSAKAVTKKLSSDGRMKNNENTIVALGPHRVEFVGKCQPIKLSVRVTGDALMDIPLVEVKEVEKSDVPFLLIGKFSIPLDGIFHLDLNWYGCSSEKEEVLRIFKHTFTAKAGSSLSKKEQPSSVVLSQQQIQRNFNSHFVPNNRLFNGAWISSSRIMEDEDNPDQKMLLPPYIWLHHLHYETILLSQQKKKKKKSFSISTIKTNDGDGSFFLPNDLVVKNNDSGDLFYSFQQLSNYELVCFMGSKSARDIHSTFLSLRPHLFPDQRPFKFHYYEMNSFVYPDQTWTDDQKHKFRKCKHIILSLDEPKTPILLQSDYQLQLTTFITHLTKAIDDETFPIWIMTNMQSPMNATNCIIADTNTTRSTNHPCNIVLKYLFSSSYHSFFPSRVRLMDNTELTDSYFSNKDYHRADFLAIIALRVFAVVGKQVEHWRSDGQIGHRGGLTKGDKEYPNFKLIPYVWNTDTYI